MPLFSDKFSLKKSSTRRPDAIAPGFRNLTPEAKRIEFGIDLPSHVQLNLPPHLLVLDSKTNQWTYSSSAEGGPNPEQNSPDHVTPSDKKEKKKKVSKKKQKKSETCSSETKEENIKSLEKQRFLEIELSRLEDENRLLHLKIEILMNLLSDSSQVTLMESSHI